MTALYSAIATDSCENTRLKRLCAVPSVVGAVRRGLPRADHARPALLPERGRPRPGEGLIAHLIRGTALAGEIAHKAYPCVIRRRAAQIELLLFDHPLTLPQLPKGGIEPDEPPLDAARRELLEETGLSGLPLLAELGELDVASKPWEPDHLSEEAQRWHLFLFEAGPECPYAWTHRPTGGSDEDQHLFGCRWTDITLASDVLHPHFTPAVHAVHRWIEGA